MASRVTGEESLVCDYQGYEFGARYPDSVCIDGRLFDADNCDNNGNSKKIAIRPFCSYPGDEVNGSKGNHALASQIL